MGIAIGAPVAGIAAGPRTARRLACSKLAGESADTGTLNLIRSLTTTSDAPSSVMNLA